MTGVPVTMFKHLPFNAGKTAHLDRLCQEIPSKTIGPIDVDFLSVCCKKYILRLSKHKCFVTQFVTNNVQRKQR